MPAPNPIDRLYRWVVGDRVLLAVLALLALTLLVGLLLPQLPVEIQQQDAATRWLAETSRQFGSLGTVLRDAGLFSLWHSPWLRWLLAGLAFILLLRLGLAVGQAMSRLQDPDPTAVAAEAVMWPLQAALDISGDLNTGVVELSEDLLHEDWQVATVQTESAAHVTAERNRWGVLAPPLIYLGLLVMLAGFWLNRFQGWQESGIMLVPGEFTPVESREPLSLSLAEPAAGLLAVVARWEAGAEETYPFSARGIARPAGITVQRTGEGLALSITAQDSLGTPLQLQPLEDQSPVEQTLNLVFDRPRAERVFLVPERQLAFSVVAFPALPERGFTGPAFLVQVFEVGRSEPVVNQFIEGDSTLDVNGDTFLLHSGRFIEARVSRSPGIPLLVGALLIALAGVLLGVIWPASRLHLRLTGQRDLVKVQASLQPSPVWRQASRWLNAWAATYGGGDPS